MWYWVSISSACNKMYELDFKWLVITCVIFIRLILHYFSFKFLQYKCLINIIRWQIYTLLIFYNYSFRWNNRLILESIPINHNLEISVSCNKIKITLKKSNRRFFFCTKVTLLAIFLNISFHFRQMPGIFYLVQIYLSS